MLGLAVGQAAREAGPPSTEPPLASDGPRRSTWLLPAVAIFAAVAPDLDFLPGIAIGDPNRFHQLGSHSLLASLLAGMIAGLATVPTRWRAGVVGVTVGLAYASHLLLDYFTHDPRAPFGIPLLWPLSSEHFTSPSSVFRGIVHGVPGEGMGEVVSHIFSMHNLVSVGIELAVTLPLLVLVHVALRPLLRRRAG